MKFYKAGTKQPENMILYEKIADEDDCVTRWRLRNRVIYPDRETLIQEGDPDMDGTMYYKQDDKLMECTFYGKNWWRALSEDEVYEDPGINWTTLYSPNIKRLYDKYKKSYDEDDRTFDDMKKAVKYEHGVYSLHVHICDGRI